MTLYSDIRVQDPVIRQILQHLASRNIQKLDLDAIAKILYEGADGRYLTEINQSEINQLNR